MAILRPDRVLWRTRGTAWDYRFIVYPTSPELAGWYRVHSAVFEGADSSHGDVHRHGTLGVDGQWSFSACAVTDDDRRDGSGRPVVHYLVWLHGERSLRARGDWPERLLTTFGTELDSLLASSGPVVDDAVTNFCRIVREAESTELDPYSETIPSLDVGVIVESTGTEKKKPKSGLQRKRVLVLLSLALILVAILGWMFFRLKGAPTG